MRITKGPQTQDFFDHSRALDIQNSPYCDMVWIPYPRPGHWEPLPADDMIVSLKDSSMPYDPDTGDHKFYYYIGNTLWYFTIFQDGTSNTPRVLRFDYYG